jgi:hypothetical protein
MSNSQSIIKYSSHLSEVAIFCYCCKRDSLCEMPRTPSRGVQKDDPEYLEKRAKNNEAIKKSRERARNKQKETEVNNMRQNSEIYDKSVV